MAFHIPTPRPHRPTIMGTRHVVSAGHYLAAQAGFLVLEAGGNAIDAGVATGIALNVLEPQMCCFAGVAPTIVHLAESGETLSIDGLGTWPKLATLEYFQRNFPGEPIPEGILQTVVPAAPDAWITLLERWGTIGFADAAAAAVRFARDGFPMHPQMTARIKERAVDFEDQTASAAIFLPNGRAAEPGEVFYQRDLGKTLQFLIEEERAAARTGGRAAGLAAVRKAFYRGDIGKAIVDFHLANGGLMRAEDMAGYRVTVEAPIRMRFLDIDVYTCGPWCQGPMLLQELALLAGFDLARLKHNSPDYIHTVTEAVKLAAADREAYYGDPKFVDVPLAELLSEPYNAERRRQIRADRAWPEMPPAGAVGRGAAAPGGGRVPQPAAGRQRDRALDTTYLCVVDRHGNSMSCTPSDGVMRRSPVIPGTGLVPSGRGNQSRTDPAHPSCLAPGKRPRLTPNPAFAAAPGWTMPFGTPGGDLQTQAMLQFFLNFTVFGMDPQAAVEAPRFGSFSFPDSFSPHPYYPGLLKLEPELPKRLGKALAARGHTVEWWSHEDWSGTGVCAVVADKKTGVLYGAADRRRTSYALGW